MKKHGISSQNQLALEVQHCNSTLNEIRSGFKKYLRLTLDNPLILIPDIITEYFNSELIKKYFLYLDFEITHKKILGLLPEIESMHPLERDALFKRIISQRQENINGSLLDDFTHLSENQLEGSVTPSLTPASKALTTFLKAYGNIQIETISQYLEWFYPSIKKTIHIQVRESEDKFEFELDEMNDTDFLSSIDLKHLHEFKPASSDEIIHIQFLDLYKNTSKRTQYLIALHEFLSKNETLYQKLKNTNWFQPYHYAILNALFPNDFKKKLESTIIVLHHHNDQLRQESLPFFGNGISKDIYYINDLFSSFLSLPQETIHLLESIPLCHESCPNFNHFRNRYIINSNSFTLSEIITVLKQFNSAIAARNELNLALPSIEANSSNELSTTKDLIPCETTAAPIQCIHLDYYKIHYFIDDILISEKNIIPPSVTLAFLHKFGHFSVANQIVSSPMFFKERSLSIELFGFLCDLKNVALIQSLAHHFEHLFVGKLPDIIENYRFIYNKLGEIPDYLATQLITSLPISRNEYQDSMQYKRLSSLGLSSRKITDPDKVNFVSTILSTFITQHYKLRNISDEAMSSFLLAKINIIEVSNHKIRYLFEQFEDDEIHRLIMVTLKNKEITIKDMLYLRTCLSTELKIKLEPEFALKIRTLKHNGPVNLNKLLKFGKKWISANVAAELVKHSESYQLSNIEALLAVIRLHLNKHPDWAAAYFYTIPSPYDELVLRKFLSEQSEFIVETLFNFLKINKIDSNLLDDKANRFFKIMQEKLDDILLRKWDKFLGKLCEQNQDPHFSVLFTHLLKPYLDVCDKQLANLVLVAIFIAQVPFESLVNNFSFLKNEHAISFIDISQRSPTQAFTLPQRLLLLCSNNLPQDEWAHDLYRRFIQMPFIAKPIYFFKSMRDLFINSPHIVDKLLSERFFLLKPLLVTVEYLDLLIEAIPDTIKSHYEKKCLLQCETDILVMRQLCSDLCNYQQYFDLHRSIFNESPNTNHFLCQIKLYLTLPGFFNEFFEKLEEADNNSFMQFLITLFKDKLYDTLLKDRELLLFFKTSPEREEFLSSVKPCLIKEIHDLLDSTTEDALTTQVMPEASSSLSNSKTDHATHTPVTKSKKRTQFEFFEESSEKRVQTSDTQNIGTDFKNS